MSLRTKSCDFSCKYQWYAVWRFHPVMENESLPVPVMVEWQLLISVTLATVIN